MIWTLAITIAALSMAVVLGFRWMLHAQKQTIEMLIGSSTEVAQVFERTTKATYAHLKEASPIGGLPKELWLEQHELRKSELKLRERQLDIETPLRQEALKAKLRKAHRLNGQSRVTNPEG